jgi:hypothetical protein
LTWLAAQAGGDSGALVSVGSYNSGIATPAAQPPAIQAVTAPSSNVVSNGTQVASAYTAVGSYPAPMATPPTPAVVTVPPAASTPTPVDAVVNLGAGPYPLASTITTGNAQPWYNSQQISSFFGGPPTPQQQQSFDNAILQRVQQTFSQSGVPITLTSDPNVHALHTISLVSNTSSATVASAIGMTQVGSNGFSFIDQSAKSAQSLDQLEWIVAHNISHELMLAYGVPENYDQSGKYVDAKVANWAMMVDPNATFSPAAIQAISQALQNQSNLSSTYQGAQSVGPFPSAIPEPATWAIWSVAASAICWLQRGRSRRTQNANKSN